MSNGHALGGGKMSRNLPTVKKSGSLEQLSPLQLYLKEIAKYPLLSPEEELESAKAHFEQDDVVAAHRLVTANLRLVVKIAHDFKQASSSLLDLIQEGNYGLMQAVKKYNPYKGVKLSSYAAWWIRAYILKYIMDNRSQVRIGTTAAQRKLYYNLQKETDKLLREYDSVDAKMLASSLEVKEKEVVEMQMRLGSPDVSLDAPAGGDNSEGGESVLRGSLLASDEINAEAQLVIGQIKGIFKQHIAEFSKTLNDRDRDIFDSRLLSEKPLTLQEIGNKYGVSRERARQLEVNIIKRLKAFVKDSGVIDI